MIKSWSERAWDDYLWWLENDRRVLKKINALIRDIERTPFEGLGKPEPLKYGLSGLWSRRIDLERRLVYSVEEDVIRIYSARSHY